MSLLSKPFSRFDEILKRIKRQDKAGFTMIELLVVIAVIGVLAVAVLSSINPIEQINKGRDTRTRSDAAQLINAVDRYFAIHEVYPWNVDNDGAETSGDGYVAPVGYDEPNEPFNFIGSNSILIDSFGLSPTETDWDWIDVLVSTAEVKQGFTNRLRDDNKLFVGKENGYNETMYACFMPTSKAFQQEAQANCENGTTTSPIAGTDVCDIDQDGTPDLDQDNLICLP